ncbi:hypothetical protein [Roseomonas sp. WA12]
MPEARSLNSIVAPLRGFARHFNALPHLDPRSAILAYAMWAARSAASLLAPGDLMARAIA